MTKYNVISNIKTDEEWKIRKIIGAKLQITSGRTIKIGTLLICFLIYWFYGLLLALSFCTLCFLGILYYAQDNLLYHPDIPQNSRLLVPIPTTHNLPHETITIRTPDNVLLHSFWIRQPEIRSKCVPTIIYLHGNSGNMGHRMKNVWGIYNKLQCNILMVEYRGYGLSTGSPCEYGLIIDAKSAIDYLLTRDDLDHQQIFLFGRSLGGAVAIAVAHDDVYAKRIRGLIVENTFTNIPEMALELIHPYIKYVPTLFYKNQFHSKRKIRCITIPILFISGLNDTLVPPRMMNCLFQECGALKKRILVLEGGTHNDTWCCDNYYPGIALFLDECHNIVNTQPYVQNNIGKESIFGEITKNEIQNV